MKNLLVSGCSVTHGAELFHPFMNPENVKLSYSHYLAENLDCQLVNVALCAGSNEYIFHSLVENLQKLDNIHSVVVMWTWPSRLWWQNNDRHYFVLPDYSSSFKEFYDYPDRSRVVNGCSFSGDTEEAIQTMIKLHSLLISEYFDIKEMNRKLDHYRISIKAICESKQIKLIDLSVDDFIKIGTWRHEKRHPNALEHKEMFEIIFKKYYDTQL